MSQSVREQRGASPARLVTCSFGIPPPPRPRHRAFHVIPFKVSCIWGGLDSKFIYSPFETHEPQTDLLPFFLLI